MSPLDPPEHFRDFRPTSYILLRQAQTDQQARAELLCRYGAVARRYLGGALRHEPDCGDAVDECFQRFSQKMLEGGYLRDGPAGGRFRDFLRVCLRNLVTDYQREKARAPAPLSGLDVADNLVSDDDYREMCREGVMQRALEALRQAEQQSGPGHYTVLRLRMDHPDAQGDEMAELLARQFGKPTSAEAARQQLSRARKRLREQLMEEVRLDLDDPSPANVEQELAELGLLQYVRHGG